MEYRTKPKSVIITTVDGKVMFGKVNLGVKERLSDVFTKDKSPFVVLFDAVFGDVPTDKKKVLFVNKDHIAWAEPVD